MNGTTNYRELISNRLSMALSRTMTKQKDLARAICVPDNTISYFCNPISERIPNTEQIIKIAHYLNISSDFLLGISNTMFNDEPELKAVCDYTGLSDSSVILLHEIFRKGYSIPGYNTRIEILEIIDSFINSDCLPEKIFLYFDKSRKLKKYCDDIELRLKTNSISKSDIDNIIQTTCDMEKETKICYFDAIEDFREHLNGYLSYEDVMIDSSRIICKLDSERKKPNGNNNETE